MSSINNSVLFFSVSKFCSNILSEETHIYNYYTYFYHSPVFLLFFFTLIFSFSFPHFFSLLFCMFQNSEVISSVRKLTYTTIIPTSITLFSFFYLSSPYSSLFPFLISFLLFSFCFKILQSIFSMRKCILIDK